jgi:pullulanase/glycogen debranching enzyme
MTLGAAVDGDGVRFAVFSGVADAVELCLFDAAGAETRQPLELGDGELWRAHVAAAAGGLRYGYRVHGPGRCDPAKLLLDPYARAIAGGVTWHPNVLAPGTGCKRCTSTASASTSLRALGARRTTSTRSAASSTPSAKTRSCPTSS